MDLSVDSTLALLDLEGTLVTPGVVPGVDSEPVVFTPLGSPTDELDGVTSESRTRLVGVDTALVGQEVLVDSEGCSYSSILEDIGLDVLDGADAVGRG